MINQLHSITGDGHLKGHVRAVKVKGREDSMEYLGQPSGLDSLTSIEERLNMSPQRN